MQRLEVSGAVRPIYGSLGVKRLIIHIFDINMFTPVFGPTAKKTKIVKHIIRTYF